MVLVDLYVWIKDKKDMTTTALSLHVTPIFSSENVWIYFHKVKDNSTNLIQQIEKFSIL